MRVEQVDDDLEWSGQNLTSGQSHLMAQVRRAAFQSMRRDETNSIKPCSRFELLSMVSYWQKIVGDLRRPQNTSIEITNQNWHLKSMLMKSMFNPRG